jgi:hypothetical protein
MSYTQGKYRNSRYWQKISYPFVLVIEDLRFNTDYYAKTGGSPAYINEVYGAQSYENAKKRIERLKQENYRYREDPTRYKFHIITQDRFNNTILLALNAGRDPGDIETMEQKQVAANLKDKPLWPVFNMSAGIFIAAFDTETAAEVKADELARKTPDTKFLICKPHSIAFQPVQVTIERVKLDA